MAHIEKRMRGGRPSYRARYRAPDGTERNKTFRRKVDAEKFLATVEGVIPEGAGTVNGSCGEDVWVLRRFLVVGGRPSAR